MKKFAAIAMLALVALAAAACNKDGATTVNPQPAGSSSSSGTPSGPPTVDPGESGDGRGDPGDDGASDAPGGGDDGEPGSGGSHTVVVKLTGTGQGRFVHYGTSTDESNETLVSLPWQETFTADSGDTVTVGASGGSGDISCVILVDGQEVAENTAERTNCEYRIP